MAQLILRLFVAGESASSIEARRNLQTICDKHFPNQCEVSVVDVLADPEMAEIHRVLATPTLIKELPEPRRRIIGDLSNVQIVLGALGIPSAEESVG